MFFLHYPYLKRFLSCVYELVSLELRRLNECFAALRAHVHPGPVRVQVFAHGTVVPEHFVATLKTQTILVNKIIT